MKTATLPPLRVEQSVRKEIERLLAPGETLSTFIEEAIHQSIERRAADAAFAERALASRAASNQSGSYHAAASVLRALKTLTKAVRRRQAPRK
jgi:hypothetical protein